MGGEGRERESRGGGKCKDNQQANLLNKFGDPPFKHILNH